MGNARVSGIRWILSVSLEGGCSLECEVCVMGREGGDDVLGLEGV